MTRTFTALALAALSAQAGATTLDVSGLTTGSISDPTVVTDTDSGIDLTFSNPDGEGLRFSTSLGSLIANGFCGDSQGLLVLNQCQGRLQIDFSAPVDDLTFVQEGISLLPGTEIEVEFGGGQVVSGASSSLIDISLLGAFANTIDLSALSGVTRVTVDDGALASTGSLYGDFDFVASEVNAVPLSPSAALLLSALGMLGLYHRRVQAA